MESFWTVPHDLAAPQHAQLNRLLRRVDWRFFLPHPNPRKTICFSQGKLADTVATISQCVFSPCEPGASKCDLAVVTDPDPLLLARAWSALARGGSIYCEWTSRTSAARARRALERAGFYSALFIRAWPVIGTPQFWMPLEAPPVRAYVKDARPRPRTPLRRVAARMLWSGWKHGLRNRRAPLCAIASKAPPDASRRSGQDQIPAPLGEVVRAGWRDWGLGPEPPKLHWLLLTFGKRSISKVVGLVFGSQPGRPVMAVKMPRNAEAARSLAHEASVLQALHGNRPSLRGVPRVLFSLDGEFRAVAETAMPGRPLYSHLTRRNYRELALTATRWLVNFTGQGERVEPNAWWNRLIAPVIGNFERAFGAAIDSAMLRETERILKGLPGMPLVCEQRDFSPWNVFVSDGGEVAVLDWESAALEGLPALDLIYFLAYHAFEYDRATDLSSRRESYRASLSRTLLTGRVREECMAEYTAACGLDLAAIPPLRLLTWLIHAQSEYKAFSADAGGVPPPEMLRRSLFLALWEEELSHQTSGDSYAGATRQNAR